MLHSAALVGSFTAHISGQRTTSSWYGDCGCCADSWRASNITSGSVDTFAAHRTMLIARVTVTAAVTFTVTYCDKVHCSAAVSRQWQLIQLVSQRCPMSVNLIWMLSYTKHTLTQSSASALQTVKFSHLYCTNLTAFISSTITYVLAFLNVVECIKVQKMSKVRLLAHKLSQFWQEKNTERIHQ